MRFTRALAASSMAFSRSAAAPKPAACTPSSAARMTSSSSRSYASHSSLSMGRSCVSRCSSSSSAASAARVPMCRSSCSELCPFAVSPAARPCPGAASAPSPSVVHSPSAPAPTIADARSHMGASTSQWSIAERAPSSPAMYVASPSPTLASPLSIMYPASHASCSLPSRSSVACACRSPATTCASPSACADAAARCSASRAAACSAACCSVSRPRRVGMYACVSAKRVPSAFTRTRARCIRPLTGTATVPFSISTAVALYHISTPAPASSGSAGDECTFHSANSPVCSSAWSRSVSSGSSLGSFVSCMRTMSLSCASVRMVRYRRPSACQTNAAVPMASGASAARACRALAAMASRSRTTTPPWFRVTARSAAGPVAHRRRASPIASAHSAASAPAGARSRRAAIIGPSRQSPHARNAACAAATIASRRSAALCASASFLAAHGGIGRRRAVAISTRVSVPSTVVPSHVSGPISAAGTGCSRRTAVSAPVRPDSPVCTAATTSPAVAARRDTISISHSGMSTCTGPLRPATRTVHTPSRPARRTRLPLSPTCQCRRRVVRTVSSGHHGASVPRPAVRWPSAAHHAPPGPSPVPSAFEARQASPAAQNPSAAAWLAPVAPVRASAARVSSASAYRRRAISCSASARSQSAPAVRTCSSPTLAPITARIRRSVHRSAPRPPMPSSTTSAVSCSWTVSLASSTSPTDAAPFSTSCPVVRPPSCVCSRCISRSIRSSMSSTSSSSEASTSGGISSAPLSLPASLPPSSPAVAMSGAAPSPSCRRRRSIASSRSSCTSHACVAGSSAVPAVRSLPLAPAPPRSRRSAPCASPSRSGVGVFATSPLGAPPTGARSRVPG